MSTPSSASLVLVHPAPLERLVIPAALDGHAGTNRATGGVAQIAAANVLEKASAHWLRHSAGSHMADHQVDLRHVRDNFGHASLTTTSIYLHVDEDRRHQETDEKHRIEW